MSTRQDFEAWIKAPPYERHPLRFPETSATWPGNYRELNIDLAWCAYQAGADSQQAQIERLRAALAELVACKDLKDAMQTTRSDPYYITQADSMEIEYSRRKPLAWDAARSALAATKDTP